MARATKTANSSLSDSRLFAASGGAYVGEGVAMAIGDIEDGNIAESAVAAARVVLVVEDDVILRMLACDILKDGGFDPLEAVNADEAQALLEARPDIALMFTDIEMPGEINGLGLARLAALRSPGLPILITSGAVALDKMDLPPHGRFVQRPYSPSVLLELVGTMMGD